MLRSWIIFAGLLLSTSPLWAQVSVSRGPYLQNPTEGSIVIRWRTSTATTGTVRYGNSPTNLSQTATEASATTEHEVEISGLSSQTTYYYGIGDGTNWHTQPDSNYRFKTSPPAGSTPPIRIWATGDFGKGNANQVAVMNSFMDYNQQQAPDVWVWLGDNAYDNGTDQEYQDKVFDSTNAYGTIFPFTPFMPSPGNHDYNSIAPPFTNTDPNTHSGAYYDLITVPINGEAGGVASNKELFYSFDYGNVHFVSCNSEIGSLNSSSNDWIGTFPLINPFASSFSSSPFTQWLHADLAANTQRWTVVYFHQPPFTDGSHDATSFWEVYMKAMRENITPIFEQYNVDLVLSGHSHVYERSYLIHGHHDDANTWNPATMLVDGNSGVDSIGEAYVKDLSQPNGAEGTIYIVCGNSASKDDNPNLQYPAMYYGYGCDTCIGSLILDVHGDTLSGHFLNAYGDIFDDFTIYKINGATANETAVPALGMELVPNPTAGDFRVNITAKTAGSASLRIFDTRGRQLHQQDLSLTNGAQSIEVNTARLQLPTGAYFVVVSQGEEKITRKLVVR